MIVGLISTSSSDPIIMDFFSGSATTAHAVMKLNAEDGGHRKFIMVQLPEETDEKSEAHKAGYDTICDIGKERIRRSGSKIKEELNALVLAYQKQIDFLNAQSKSPSDLEERVNPISHEIERIEKILSKIDIGFRVLKLDSSNMEDVYYMPDATDFNHIEGLIDNVKSDRTSEDLLYQTILGLGIELSVKIERNEIAGKEVFIVDNGYLVATFDKDVNETTITEIAKMCPAYFVMRDASAANDNVLDNFEQIFRHYSPDTICKIL